jgi:hypothetical protein
MHQYDVWIDLECTLDASLQVVCALFAKMSLPIRPFVGEPLTFWSRQNSDVKFSVITAVGTKTVHYVSTEVDNVAHHAQPSVAGSTLSTNVRCLPVHVATLADAQLVVAFLTTQHGFELDPYGVNKLLGHGQSAA